MNKERRKRLEDVITQLEELQCEVASIAEEEREAYDNMPEGLQYSEQGEQLGENADDLDSIDGDFESLLYSLCEIFER